ncbi:MAG TPA: type IV secretion system DNA-binding domain-containing protein [Candidatus Paceibacterota bacterium]|nr:type IV secretion system DNA-binding domain-containing protein [Candidatus Paceibacterota bacterium]
MQEASARSPLADEHALDTFLLELIDEICARHDLTPSIPLGEALWAAIRGLLYAEGFLLDLPDRASLARLTVEEGVLLRAALTRHLRFLTDHARLLSIWREKLVWLFSGILGSLPVSALREPTEGADDTLVFPEAPIAALLENLPEALDRTIATFFDEDIANAHLFERMRERLEDNALVASGIPRERGNAPSGKALLPSERHDKSGDYLVEAYFRGTPLLDFFRSPLPFAIPAPVRLEHMHILGGTGHGKTQLIQYLLTREQGGFCVIDSQGDMIEKIARRFPDVILLDPTDVAHPLALNMFDMKTKDEAELNATIALYEYIFSGLLGAELTQRQSLLFGSIARLMLLVPDATIHTLIDVMEHGERFKPYMERLGGTAARFFEEQFFQKSFQANKQQILARLYGVLENRTFDRIFSAPRNKIDFFEAMNAGKIVLVNTAKSFFQAERSSIFGRFVIAMIAQAAVRRASIPESKRTPWFVYIDEFHEYVRGGDRQVEDLFNQARKYRVGLICSHQNLGQLEDKLRATIMASTAIKIAGGVSAKDAQFLAQEMRCQKEAILNTRKRERGAEWICAVRNLGTQKVTCPFGALEAMPERPDYDAFLEENRRRYAMQPEERTKHHEEEQVQPRESESKSATGSGGQKPVQPDQRERDDSNDDIWG